MFLFERLINSSMDSAMFYPLDYSHVCLIHAGAFIRVHFVCLLLHNTDATSELNDDDDGKIEFLIA